MIDPIVDLLGSGLVLLGLTLATIGLYGMLRKLDIFHQLHAAGLVSGAAVLLVLLASFATGSAQIITSAILVGGFVLITSPLSGHAAARAAWRRTTPDDPGAESRRDAAARQAPDGTADTGTTPSPPSKAAPR